MFGYRLASIPAVIALVLATATPGASAAGHRIERARAQSQATKPRRRRPKPPTPGTQASPKATANPICVNADTSASSAPRIAMTASVLCLVNQQRAAHGLPALHEDARLDRSAQSWTNAMVQTGTFSHGTHFTGRIDAVGYAWSIAGENLGTGYATPRQIVTAWMASPDHCRNLLNPSYADAGTGVLGRGIGSYGPSTWTQDFGLAMDENAPSSNSAPMNACPDAG